MNRLAKVMVLLATGAAVTGCQSEEERTKAARDTMIASCRERTQTSPTMNVDVDQFCNCLADGLLAQGVDGPPPDTALIGEQCQQRATPLG